MNKILFPFEVNNPVYKEAYVYAVKLARNMYVELILLNAFEIEVDESITTGAYNQKIKSKWLDAYNEVSSFNTYYIEQFARVDDQIKVPNEYKFVHGKLDEEIKKVLNEDKIDFVVLPTFINSQKNKEVIQLIRDDIFKRNVASVLAIPEGFIYQPIKNICFTIDFKKLHFNEVYFKTLGKFADIFGATIHFVHVNSSDKAVFPEDTDVYRSMMKIIERNNKHSFESIHSKNIALALTDYVAENNIDVLVTIKHELGIWDKLFSKSTSESLTFKSKIPVLVMREKVDVT